MILRMLAPRLIRLVCGARANWVAGAPHDGTAVYFANHTSHLDFPLIWSALPADVRARTQGVAATDYWGRNRLRRFLAVKVFGALLIERGHVDRENHPVAKLSDAIARGHSLILFPEGTRSMDGCVHPFKSGIFYLRRALPEVDFVPAYVDNLNRILPKGEIAPVPMMSSVTFGMPMTVIPDEARNDFLGRAREAVEALMPS